MTRKSLFAAAALLGLTTSVFATDARIEAMGKSAKFITDDISIFDNPANIGRYQNYLIGEFGSFTDNVQPGVNQDPTRPWFGGIFALGLSDDKSSPPQLNIAGVFNRVDQDLQSFLPARVITNKADTLDVPTTATNFDGFLGFTSNDGNQFATHLHIALQDGGDGLGQVNTNSYAALMRADFGANFKLTDDAWWEVSAGASRVHFGADQSDFWDAGYWGGRIMTRIVSTFEFLNGELVPRGEYSVLNAQDRRKSHFDMGLGLQVNMPSNMLFWLGGEYFQEEDNTGGYEYINGLVVKDQRDESYWKNEGRGFAKEYGGRIGFGIERNIWTKWLMVRVGGTKKISWMRCKPADGQEQGFCGQEGTYYTTNASGNGMPDDHVGFGIGVDVEERLKVDAVVSEDALYRNPFQGGGRIFSRVSATYKF
jgi:hypothetical protein